MSMPINLEKEDFDILLGVYESQKEKLAKQVDEITSQIQKLEDKITSLKNAKQKSNLGYNEDWTWNEKITFILEDHLIPMTANEIVQAILDFEPYLERKKLMSSISATLTVAAGKKYKKIEQPGKEIKYELIT